jgi:phosphoribosylformylglycinamidine synthase subunit PurSL
VRACHDVSEGGLAVALAEMSIGGRLGMTVDTLPHPDHPIALFSESTGRLVVEVAPDALDELRALLDEPVTVLGAVSTEPVVRIVGMTSVDVDELVAAFTSAYGAA